MKRVAGRTGSVAGTHRGCDRKTEGVTGITERGDRKIQSVPGRTGRGDKHGECDKNRDR